MEDDELQRQMLDAVRMSVMVRRRMTGATGTPESEVQVRPEVISHRMVQDPSLSDSQFYYERSQNPNKPNLGKTQAATNMVTLIGGLALIRRRLNHHERAAEWFKSAYESLYGGGMAPSIDLGEVRVDTSIMAHDNGMVSRIDHARKLRALIVGTQDEPPQLTKSETDRIVACVVLGIPCEGWADEMPSGQRNQRQVAAATTALLDALDKVAEIRGFKMRECA